ncbi:alkaline shock response membrane anchor protein AmaP [Kitasatospora sp. NPDC096147]|uniref:alkaline shock response membrane anchor protein AmaP n=1 Tax=Kitasatospora sp. NPDC096147 TaxID=3364093 RepID=UPI00381EE8C1
MSRGTVNRAILLLAGVALLAGGVLVLAGGLDLYGRIGWTPPSRWPLTSPDQPVFSDASRTRWTGEGWWWPALFAVLGLTVACGLWWLVAQVRRSGPATVALPVTAPGLSLRLRTRALADAVETEAIALPEVARVRAQLTGPPKRLRLRAAVRLTPDADPADTLEQLHSGPFAHARSTLARELPAELRVRVVRPPAPPRRAAARPRVT